MGILKSSGDVNLNYLLPASILKRLPVRFNYNYYNKTYQGIPREGYSELIENMIDHKNITLMFNTGFDSSFNVSSFDYVFYSRPIDAFFNYKYGRLSYRTMTFKKEKAVGDFQGNAVINYTDLSVPYTRIHEHKHFMPYKNFEETVYFKEYNNETGDDDEPYYPKRLEDDMITLEKYINEVKKNSNISFLGRLGTYRYMDMELVIQEALKVSKQYINKNLS